MNDTNIRGKTTFKLGGTEVTSTAKIEYALDIEARIGLGLVALFRQNMDMRAGHAAIIISATTGRDVEDVLNAMFEDGVTVHIANATRILAHYLAGPSAEGRQGAKKPKATASP
jgi:hypothetical protein